MSSNNQTSDFYQFLKDNALKAIVGLITLAFIFGFTSWLFKDSVKSFILWVSESLGVFGLSLAVFISDAFISPISPDVALVIISNSPLKENWFINVTFIGLFSMVAGHVGWLIGYNLHRFKKLRKTLQPFIVNNKPMIRKYGGWAVVIGALTPFPFSITCWTAGLLKMKWSRFALFCSLRLFRMYLYYFFILYSSKLIDAI